MWKTTFNVYVSQRSQIQFEDEHRAVYISFRRVTTTLFSLRTTTCDALFVPSVIGTIKYKNKELKLVTADNSSAIPEVARRHKLKTFLHIFQHLKTI